MANTVKAFDISSATAQVASVMLKNLPVLSTKTVKSALLKTLLILSAKTVKRSSVELEHLKPN